MAKNLQSVLNSVVNDLLQESGDPSKFEGMRGLGGSMVPKGWADDVTGGTDNVFWGQDAMAAKVAAERAKEEGLASLSPIEPYNPDNMFERGYKAQMENPALASVSGVDGENGIDTPYKQAMYKARHGLDAVKQWIADNPGLALGAGALGGSALAAGAGALYLRKKQRDANRRAGR